MNDFQQFAQEFALKAGALMKKNFLLGMSKEWKKDNTPVTATDLEINHLLIQEINHFFPSHGILAEEESALKDGAEYVWVCDPLDGTLPFGHGIPIATFALALTKNGESILSAVCDPFQDRLFTAAKGQGAFLNGNPIHVSSMSVFKGSVADIEMSSISKYDLSKLALYLNVERGVKVFKLNSYTYAAMLVAAGELAFALYPSSPAHDTAMAKIIVEEAGGKVTSLFGQDQRYDGPVEGLIASNGALHEELVARSKEMVIVRAK